jgi:rare lipoprotein A
MHAMSTGDSVLRRLVPLGLVLAVLAGCSSSPSQPMTGSSQASVINPERSSRGNPPYYEVFGERYYVLDSSDGFRERGVASWYGRDFHGKPTSSGEPYDMYQLTAAHKTLPIPTWVEVTNETNGRQVIVKVNDRGPFVDDRIIDLSLRAAEELDMIENGTARVRVRALGAPATFNDPPQPVLADSSSRSNQGSGFSIISEARADTGTGDAPFRPAYVQVGAFSDRNNAARLVERLEDGGFVNIFVLTSGDGRDRMHRVRIGPVDDSAHFDRIRSDLRDAGIYEATLVQGN